MISVGEFNLRSG